MGKTRLQNRLKFIINLHIKDKEKNMYFLLKFSSCTMGCLTRLNGLEKPIQDR